MYDELIKDLREWPRVCVEYTGSLDELLDKAADAIEELSKPRRQRRTEMFTKDALREFIKHFEGFPDQVIAMAWVYADCLTKYGVDVSAEWQTVTDQRDALNRAYLQGRAEEAERRIRREAEEGE